MPTTPSAALFAMPANPDAAILCGGAGTRLAALHLGVPKALLPVGGRPFVAGLAAALARQGVARIVLCTGQGREQIRAYFDQQVTPAEILFSEETEPLGTGGALRLALPLLRGDLILALNGDSWAPFHLPTLIAGQQQAGAEAAILAAPADDRADAGSLRVDSQGRIRAFAEKQPIGARLHSAGIYLVRRGVLQALPAGRAISLERDVLPQLLDGRMIAVPAAGPLLDIGTPERLARAQAAAAAGANLFGPGARGG